MMIPFDSACSHAAAVNLERQRFEPGDEIGADQPSRFRFADVHVVAAVGLGRGREDGVGRRSDSRRPEGSLTPHTLPVCWYSFQPEPERYPRATHSIGIGSVRRASIVRPRRTSAIRLCRFRELFDVERDEMVRHEIADALEPEA